MIVEQFQKSVMDEHADFLYFYIIITAYIYIYIYTTLLTLICSKVLYDWLESKQLMIVFQNVLCVIYGTTCKLKPFCIATFILRKNL